MASDMVRVKMATGEQYEIPGIWIAGYCRDGRTVQDAIAWWRYQAGLEKQLDAQRTASATVDTYLAVAENGRRIGRYTLVRFADGYETKFMAKLGKREAIRQALAGRI